MSFPPPSERFISRSSISWTWVPPLTSLCNAKIVSNLSHGIRNKTTANCPIFPDFSMNWLILPSFGHPKFVISVCVHVVSSRAKSSDFVRAFWKRRSEEWGGQQAGQRALVLAGGVAMWPRGPRWMPVVGDFKGSSPLPGNETFGHAQHLVSYDVRTKSTLPTPSRIWQSGKEPFSESGSYR
jgi:hypothetical protein